MATAAKSISPGPVGVEPGQIPLPGAAEMFAAMVSSAGSESGGGDRAENPSAEVKPEDSADPAVTIIDAAALLPMLDQQRAAAPAATLVAEPAVVSVKAQALASAQAQVVAKAGGAPVTTPTKDIPVAQETATGVTAVSISADAKPVQAAGIGNVPVAETSVDPKQPAVRTLKMHSVERAKLSIPDRGSALAKGVQEGAEVPAETINKASRVASAPRNAAPVAVATGQLPLAPVLQGDAPAPATPTEMPVARTVEVGQPTALPIPGRAPAITTRAFDGGKPAAPVAAGTAHATPSTEAEPAPVAWQTPVTPSTDNIQPIGVTAAKSVSAATQQPVAIASQVTPFEPQTPTATATVSGAGTGPSAAAPISKAESLQPPTAKADGSEVHGKAANPQPVPVVARTTQEIAAAQPMAAKAVVPEVQVNAAAQAAPVAAKSKSNSAAPQVAAANAAALEAQAVVVEAQAAPIAARTRASRIAVAPAEIRIEPGAVADAATAPIADTRAAAQPLHAAPAPVQPLAAPTGAPLPNVAAALSQQVLDMSGGDAWIDQIARDISQTAGKDGAMRFRLAPETLGELKVEITHSERGAHVRLNVSSEGAQQALAAAEHKLTAEARAQGVRIAETEINFTGGQSRDASSFAREQGQQAQQQSNQQPRMSRGTSANSFTSSAAAPEGRGRTDRYA